MADRTSSVLDPFSARASASNSRPVNSAPVREPPRLSILHIVCPAAVGGGERVVQALAIGQRRSAHLARVAAVLDPGSDDHPFVRPLLNAGVEVYPLFVPPRAYMMERRLIHDLCRRLRPDVVHTHGHRPDVVDAGVAQRLGVSTITTVHGSSLFRGRHRVYNWLQWKVLRRFNAVVAVSRELAETAARCHVPQERIYLIPNAWTGAPARLERDSARDALGLPRHGFLVGWVGRLLQVKGADIFLKALGRLRDLKVSATIIGDGPERIPLESQAATLGLKDQVRFVGQLNDAAALFSAFDVFVLSSRSEGTPITLFEAMAAGLPIVATSVGGIPDILSEAEGRLVPPDDPEALSMAIRALYNDAAEAQRRAIRARRRLAADFALEPWLGRYEAVYRRIRP